MAATNFAGRPLKRDEQLKRVCNLYLRGITQREIARQCGISLPCVVNDLKQIRKDWLQGMITDYDERKQKELARIDLVEEQSWWGWERSSRDSRVNETMVEGEKSRASVKTHGQAGDPRFLERVSWCIEQRCRIFGFYQHGSETKVNLTLHHNETAILLSKASDQQLADLEAHWQQVLQEAGGKGGTGVAGAIGAAKPVENLADGSLKGKRKRGRPRKADKAIGVVPVGPEPLQDAMRQPETPDRSAVAEGAVISDPGNPDLKEPEEGQSGSPEENGQDRQAEPEPEQKPESPGSPGSANMGHETPL